MSIGNLVSDLLIRKVNQSKAWFPIDLCFQLTYASNGLAHSPALTPRLTRMTGPEKKIVLGEIARFEDFGRDKNRARERNLYISYLYFLGRITS